MRQPGVPEARKRVRPEGASKHSAGSAFFVCAFDGPLMPPVDRSPGGLRQLLLAVPAYSRGHRRRCQHEHRPN